MNRINASLLLSVFTAGALALGVADAAQAAPVKNIVLVHGAFVNGSGWKPVYEILRKDGYNVSIAEHPLTSFADDVTAVKRIVDQQDGPTILVGHSYGGAIITDVGNDAHVVGLVYIAAHALDQGETEAQNGKLYPNATKAVKKTADGFLSLDPALYPADFAADLPKAQAEFEAISQEPTAASVFTTPLACPRGKPNRAGTQWPAQTGSSTRTLSACTPSGPTATPSRSKAPVTRCTSPVPKRWPR
ncbi:alpha/beta hydrolase [Pseudomonas sp. 15A4]|uniref:alpha/beta fold hydrolase n=1 Tax=Pseudomonas sp. 15A4 TaxID=2804761 RepID=UPI0019685084|nr:alpha/beta hydrolase [Pseudomonas sp. 15A4]QSB21176.1 alpha/beta hydrolase [Pseudomonas sp. 15A4]